MIGIMRLGKNLNLSEIKIWTWVLFKSFSDLGSKSTFSVDINELKELTGKDEESIRLSFINLVAIQLKSLNYENHTLSDREIMPMLSCARFKGNNIFYEFSASFAKKMRTEENYRKMVMLVQNQFTSKYAKVIYGLCLSFLDTNEAKTEIKLTLEQLRTYLDFKDYEYLLFKEINRTILKKSLDEINDKSNIFVEIDYIREKKNVVAIILTIKINKGNLMKYPELKEKELETAKSEVFRNQDMRNFMDKYSINSKVLNNKINELIDQGIAYEDIEKYILYVKNLFKSAKTSDSSVFLNSLSKRDNIEEFLQKTNADRIKKRERDENSLYTLYKSSELTKVIEFLEKHEKLFYKLVDKYMSNMSVKVLRYSLTFDELVRSFTIAEILLPDVQKLEKYDYISFDDWKAQRIDNTTDAALLV